MIAVILNDTSHYHNGCKKVIEYLISDLQSCGYTDIKLVGQDIKKIQEGDLVFFATRKNSRKVNHVGIVTNVRNGEVSFIHSSTSRGVIISKISERYWYLAYVQARRYL